MSLRELWTHEYSFDSNCPTTTSKKNPNKEKWEYNVSTIDKIPEGTHIDSLLNRKFEDLLVEFLNSKEYSNLLEILRIKENKKGNGDYYKKCFHNVACHYVTYFNEGKSYKKKVGGFSHR